MSKLKGFEVMLAKEYDPKKVDWKHGKHIIEPKMDGVRVVTLIKPDHAPVFYSRNGRELTMFGHLRLSLARLYAQIKRAESGYAEGAMFDGEMVNATGEFGDISGAIHRKDHTEFGARYHLFYAMPIQHFWKGRDIVWQGLRYQATLEPLRDNELVKIVRGRMVRSHNDVVARYAELREEGYEGAMVKDFSKHWEATRSAAWLKLKDELSVDVPVVDLKEGTGKYKGTLGALVVDFKGRHVPVSGMTDSQRAVFWDNPKRVLGKTVEVTYQEVTVHGSLRHPRFKRLRGDK